MSKFIPSLLVIIFTTTLIGCAEVDSENIRTAGFHAEITVTAKDDSTNVFTRLNTSSALDADTIILSPGDQLSASVPDRSIALHQFNSHYSGTFEGSLENTEINVSFNRLGDDDAPNSRVLVPELFEIIAPDFDETFNAGDNLTLVWSPSDPSTSATVGLHINCQVFDENGFPSGSNFGVGVLVPNSGTHTVSIDDQLNSFANGLDNLSAPGPCLLEVTVERTNEGTLDSAFMQGGFIRAKREKSVVVNYIPLILE